MEGLTSSNISECGIPHLANKFLSAWTDDAAALHAYSPAILTERLSKDGYSLIVADEDRKLKVRSKQRRRRQF
jgi:hypothetical protein